MGGPFPCRSVLTLVITGNQPHGFLPHPHSKIGFLSRSLQHATQHATQLVKGLSTQIKDVLRGPSDPDAADPLMKHVARRLLGICNLSRVLNIGKDDHLQLLQGFCPV
eukprot:364615-Chlamydomonas_euryale.AAC.45